MKHHNIAPLVLASAIAGSPFLFMQEVASQTSSFTAKDPGVRAGAAAAGGPIAHLTDMQKEYFAVSQKEFEDEDDVDEGLGPTDEPE